MKGFILFLTGWVFILVQTSAQNSQVLTFNKQVKPLKAIARESQIDSINAEEKREAIFYTDNIGRPMIDVAVRVTPDKKDLIRYHNYDKFGREPKSYLPYSSRIDSIIGSYPYDLGEEPVHPLHPWKVQMAYFESHQQTFYDAGYNPDVTRNVTPYSESLYEESPKGRLVEQSAPGYAWRMDDHKTIRLNYRTNTTGEVQNWEIDYYGNCVYAGTYGAEKIYVTEKTDENGNVILIYTDLSGRQIMSAEKVDVTNWKKTYYVYNKLGQLQYVLPPEAVKAVSTLTIGTAIAQSRLDLWAFAYKYDENGRLAEKKMPGIASIYYVYDHQDRILLIQDGVQRGNNKWSFVKYNAASRPIISGLYQHNTTVDRNQMQSYVDGLTQPTFERRSDSNYASNLGYTNLAFPNDNLAIEILSVNYYDDYDFNFDGTRDVAYQGSVEFAGQEAFYRNRGMITGNKSRVLGTGSVQEWITSAVFYDDRGRIIQTYKKYDSKENEILTLKYDYEGKVLLSKSVHHRGILPSVTVKNRYQYDHSGRLVKLYKQVNQQMELLLAQYAYNDLGQLVTKKVHSRSEKVDPQSGYTPEFLQEINFRYNERGWLSKINDADLSQQDDLFGMELNYVTPGFLSGAAQYNGNVASISWQNRLDEVRRNYGYTYDKTDQLSKARYSSGVSGLLTETDRYTLNGLTYDDNGNITSLRRRGYVQSGIPGEVGGGEGARLGNDPNGYYHIIDKLTYNYVGNQLSGVTDSVLNHNTARLDFKDGNATQGSEEYTYNANGSLTQDNNKGITNITYNVLNLPDKITFASGNELTFKYDAGGKKIYQEMKALYQGVLTPVQNIKYRTWGTYENDTTGILNTEEGRMVSGSKNFWKFEYNYTDHLGNVRLTYGENETVNETLTLTLESDTDTRQYEESKFKDITRTTDFSHSGDFSVKVVDSNGPYTYPTLPVKNGDKVEMKVWYYHQNPAIGGGGGQQMNARLQPNKVNTIVKVAKPVLALGVGVIPLTLQSDANPKHESGGRPNLIMLSAQLNFYGGFTYLWSRKQAKKLTTVYNSQYQLRSSESINPDGGGVFIEEEVYQEPPLAYLVWELRQKNTGEILKYGQVGVSSLSAQDVADNNWQQLQLNLEIDLKDIDDTEGDLFVKLVNYSGINAPVWFDDLSIKHIERGGAEIIQADHYDPFGLIIADLSYRKPNATENKKLYNAGSEWQKDLQWYSTFYRQYDPQLGRFHQFDPEAESEGFISPYQYVGNNPIRFNDPMGSKKEQAQGSSNFNDDPFGWIKFALSAEGGGFGGFWNSNGSNGTFTSQAEADTHFNNVTNRNGEFGTTITMPAFTDSRGNTRPAHNVFIPNSGVEIIGKKQQTELGKYYNSELVTGLNLSNIIRGNFEFGGAVAYQELTKGGNAIRLADKAKYTGLVKYGKVIGRAGYGITAGVAVYELATGNANTHTLVDVGVTILGVGAVAVFGTAAAPVVAVGAIGYGIWSVAGGSEWIDSNWGY